ncbi:NAD-dependent epimerase/dehydratase family protein [Marinococcus sp. PL1-022]|uniref:NAD-dependent epimerase/dehydratase family protein n=1 Tax=Marinococcus sp. PL1-022 TaxID=3095363 RepID=UPI0029C4453B|nr:NAD-dependent epimerase/dehydratase family protein [Marinococcus sp. PL1-022]MDX6153993.1 NAD-dependent epimerase/dehydratase family protein [Marinococcus sp. PL1-022]
MKRLLITGGNGYIGSSLKKWLKHYSNDYIVETISLRDESWKNANFSNYDVILHLAGIAHVSSDSKQKELYYKVNRDLTIEAAEKAKKDGVKQFIFMSSIIVYGDNSLNNGVITSSTIPYPKDFYGDSKLQAEQGIASLDSEGFKVAIVRPPMVYGENSKGNYPRLASLAKKTPIFPKVENKRSAIYIDNLCEFIRLTIEDQASGVFFPQNKEYISTSELVRLIAEVNGKNVMLTKIFNPFINLLSKKVNIFYKLFGDLVYSKSMSEYKVNYRIKTLKESIIKSENNTNE